MKKKNEYDKYVRERKLKDLREHALSLAPWIIGIIIGIHSGLISGLFVGVVSAVIVTIWQTHLDRYKP